MANIFVAASATWNGKALKKAKKDVDVFSKQVKQFARVFGVAFSATALVAFSKKAVKAFVEDEAAAKSLELQLQNTGNAFRVTEVEAYIKSLEKTYAILTDLRAPFQTLLNVTGSVELAQRSLEAALDISAGTGQSLANVVGAISAGVRGQTKGIKSLNTGIDENIIATGDMNKIMAALEKRFSGQSAARLDTYAGKMDALKKSADEASKTIGKGLVDALMILSKDNTVENLSSDFENLALAIADTVRGMAKVLEKLKQINKVPGTDSTFLEALPYIGPTLRGLEAFRNYGAQSRITELPDNAKRSASRIELKAIKDSVKFRKLENDQLKKKTAVDELAAKFDLERIGLTTALNQATDEETKLRLKAQLAILDNNEALAKKLLAEMDAAEGLKKFTNELIASTDKFSTMVNKLVGEFIGMGLSLQEASALAHMSARYSAQADSFAASGIRNRIPSLPESYFQNLGNQLQGSANYAGMSASEISMERLRESGNRPPSVNITVDAAQSGDRFSQLIAEMIQSATRNGYSTSAAGQL